MESFGRFSQLWTMSPDKILMQVTGKSLWFFPVYRNKWKNLAGFLIAIPKSSNH